MVIAIDLRALLGNRLSGVEIYCLQLVRNLVQLFPEHTFVLFSNSYKEKIRTIGIEDFSNVLLIQTSFPNKIFNLLLIFFRWPKLDVLIEKKIKKKIDLFFFPDLRPAPVSKKCKKVVTVHDLAFIHFPIFFSLKSRVWYLLLRPRFELRHTDGIIAVSETTKQDLISSFRISSQKIQVIYEGPGNFNDNISFAGGEITKKVQEKFLIQGKFFVSLSTLEPRKNLHRMLQAFQVFRKKNGENFQFVIIGQQNSDVFAKLSLKEVEGVIFTGFVSEEEKCVLLSMSEALVYVSLFEGFGLPLVEAMFMDVPLVASNTSSLPEIIGNSAVFVDPYDYQSIATGMENVLIPKVREQILGSAKIQQKRFRWKKCAEETLLLFRRIIVNKDGDSSCDRN